MQKNNGFKYKWNIHRNEKETKLEAKGTRERSTAE